jgi:SAM-dependent methyltransferase
MLDERLYCRVCRRSFPSVKGIPVLINDENSVFAVSDYIGAETPNAASQVQRKVSPLRKMARSIARAVSETRTIAADMPPEAVIEDVSKQLATRPRILSIGSGEHRYRYSADVTYTDVRFSNGIHVIADAHDLPFGDGEFDLVIAVAVLEHVADPQRVSSEIWRVLKPTGYVAAYTPFLFPVHMGAYDFTRFTYLGHRRLFRRFSDIKSGMGLGPGTVLAGAVQSFLLALSSGHNSRRLMKFLGLLLTFPVKYLDYIGRRNPSSFDGAAGFYFYGRKQNEAISDRDLIKLYRGGFS